MPTYWWDGDPTERLFMEITRRSDIGVDLRAPLSARGGVDTPGYALVDSVGEGSLVVHYDSSAEQIVGVSRATGERHKQPIWWAARGSYARQAKVQPTWLPGISVGLADFRPLTSPLPVAVLRRRGEQLLNLREQLLRAYAGKPLYFPWTPYGESIRTFQTYLAKFPSAALDVLPEVGSVAASMESVVTGSIHRDDVDDMDREIATAAGRPRPRRRGSGQGFAVDAHVRVAIESHAMNAALTYYRRLGDVVDTSRTESYDCAVDIGGATWHVEVKGTTGGAAEILLTHNEVEHAKQYPHVALFVLSKIVVVRAGDGTIEVTGGVPMVLHPWSLDRSKLTPLAYRYALAH